LSTTSLPPPATQRKTHPETSPAFDALASSCDEARQLELILFAADPCSLAGLLVSQLHLLFARLERGISASRSDFLSVLQAASNVRGEHS
jgi:hypothetical protein